MKTKILSLVLLIAFPLFTDGQKKTEITGRVLDVNQQPVQGAAIMIDQQNTGKQTNKNGAFKVKVSPSARVISIFTADGRTAEQAISGREANFTIPVAKGKEQLQPDDDQVNIGYGSVSKNNVVSPVTKVNSEKNNFVYKDIYEMLRGRPGVQVNGKSIKIQGGANTLMSGTDPLFVVDGVVVSSIDFVMPESVKSIEILKGTSAAIYGSRGANGVILITLKK